MRIKDVSFDRGEIRIRDGKGRKDRVTMLPARLREPLRQHLARVKQRHDKDPARGAGSVWLPDDLVGAYEAHRILAPRYRNDMLHIALATVASVDVVVSWNFRHIVRLDTIRLFNGVNIERGYQAVAIYSPREVTTYGRDDANPSG
jgi:integrase